MEKENNKPDRTDPDRILHPDLEDIQYPSDLEERVVRLLREQNLIMPSKSWYQNTWLKAAAGLAGIAVLFLAGYITGRDSSVELTTVSYVGQDYLLVLYNPNSFIPNETHAKEYGEWMRSVNDIGVIASGEELQDLGWTLSKYNDTVKVEEKTVTGKFGPLTGFFQIKAPSPEKALEIAGSCPHLGYNGVIEVRPIQNH